MKKLFFTIAILLMASTQSLAGSVTHMPKGDVFTVHDGITGTTTSAVINMRGYSLLAVETDFTAGAGTWVISINCSLTIDGTYVPWSMVAAANSSGSITADSGNSFIGLPDFCKVVATETGDGATITVRAQGFN